MSCPAIGCLHRKWARLWPGMSDFWWRQKSLESPVASYKIATSLLYSSGKLLQPILTGGALNHPEQGSGIFRQLTKFPQRDFPKEIYPMFPNISTNISKYFLVIFIFSKSMRIFFRVNFRIDTSALILSLKLAVVVLRCFSLSNSQPAVRLASQRDTNIKLNCEFIYKTLNHSLSS